MFSFCHNFCWLLGESFINCENLTDYCYKYGFKNIKGYEIDATLDNPYNVVEYESFIGSPLSECFNVVIGNPPYIRWKNLEDNLKRELAQSDLWNKYFNSLCDYLFSS